jgi:hypothetical protein
VISIVEVVEVVGSPKDKAKQEEGDWLHLKRNLKESEIGPREKKLTANNVTKRMKAQQGCHEDEREWLLEDEHWHLSDWMPKAEEYNKGQVFIEVVNHNANELISNYDKEKLD